MQKPKLLYASPFWPEKSGISEYSEALIWGLTTYFDITMITADYTLSSKAFREYFRQIRYDSNGNYSDYDHIIYNFGNNPAYHSYMYEMLQKYPGYVILHDFVLYYLAVGFYDKKNMLFQKVYELEGIRGIQIMKESLRKDKERDLLQHKGISAKLPMNREVLEAAQGIFVHSNYMKELLNEHIKDKNVYVIKLLQTLPNREAAMKDKEYLYRRFKIEPNAYIIGAVGFIGPSKQNRITCMAVKEYNRTHRDKVYYVMIGDGDSVDDQLGDYIYKTGFINNDDFIKAINSCDLIFNLRYPYNGESSSTLIQCMDFSKPCVVTDIGWFSELPDDIVVKFPVDITMEGISNMIEVLKRADLNKMIENAKKYINDYCMPSKVALEIYNSIKLEPDY